jgi:hypothetical protein
MSFIVNPTNPYSMIVGLPKNKQPYLLPNKQSKFPDLHFEIST